MITQPQPTPWYLVNRDLKRELRLICPGTHEKVRGVRVVRLSGEQSHLYAINGYLMDLECTADVLTGYTPMPPLKKPKLKVVEMPPLLILVSPPVTQRTPRPPMTRKPVEVKTWEDLPLFKGKGAA